MSMVQRRNDREYSASAGRGSRGGIQTVTVKANTPQAAYTKLQRVGYTRISGITAL
ncbi:hypothetical protein [Paraburkholderia sp. GAS32]|uniref:hypothetical protein n=1 Tax=Paraburkholderia sp. GAS32 TaxID=3035129 RepID=UPI003D19AB4F